MTAPTELVVGWGTLALIIAGIAQGKNRSGFGWFMLGLLGGPVVLLFLCFFRKLPRSRDDDEDEDDDDDEQEGLVLSEAKALLRTANLYETRIEEGDKVFKGPHTEYIWIDDTGNTLAIGQSLIHFRIVRVKGSWFQHDAARQLVGCYRVRRTRSYKNMQAFMDDDAAEDFFDAPQEYDDPFGDAKK